MPNNLIVTARINKYVKAYCEEKGVKQYYLSEKMGYPPKKFSQLINGRIPFQIEDLIIFCTFFNEPASKFIPLEKSA